MYSDLMYTILHNLVHHRLPSIYARYLLPKPHAAHSGTLCLLPLTVCAPYIPYLPPPSHWAFLSSRSSPQHYSYSGIAMMLCLLCSRFFRLTGSRLYLWGSIGTVIRKGCRRGRWCSWEHLPRNRKIEKWIPDERSMWVLLSAAVALALSWHNIFRQKMKTRGHGNQRRIRRQNFMYH